MLPPRGQKSSVVSGECGKNSTHDNNLEDHVKRIQSFLRMGIWTGLGLRKIPPFSPPQGQNITAEYAKIFLRKDMN
jgi:hypothetical protein